MSKNEIQSLVLASKCQCLSSTAVVTRGSLELVGFQPSKPLRGSRSAKAPVPNDRQHLLSTHGLYGKESSLYTHVHVHACENAHTCTYTHTPQGLDLTHHTPQKERDTQAETENRTESISLTDMSFCQILP